MSWAEEVARRRRVAMEGEKVVYSRSQLLLAATKPLEDAFKMFMPESKRFMSSDTELWNFLCSLKSDFSPVILRSKDVYGYSSCRSVVPDPSQLVRARARGKGGASKPRKPLVQKKRRRGARLTLRKRRRGRAGGSEESGASSTSSSPSQEASGLASSAGFPSIWVPDVSCEATVAAARTRAQSILRVNLQPVVLIERHPVLFPS